MILIIKPTARCNFNCTYCAMNDINIKEGSTTTVDPKIVDLIQQIHPDNIIITGGEPLCVDPEYYYHLKEISNVDIYATTNLKDFFLHPTKWEKLFNENWFHPSTSFQYGNGRMWDRNTVYTEELFLKVMDVYAKYVTTKPLPPFISVIDSSNDHQAIDSVLLAKRLNTQAKLNNVLPVGRCSEWYPRYKMYRIYLNIIDMGLSEYEAYCSTRSSDICPKNLSNRCSYKTRACCVDKDDNLHVAICDEMLAQGFDLSYDDIYNPKHHTIDPKDFITEQCSYCRMCMLCNGCNLNRMFAKKDPNYCSEMKKLEQSLINTGWAM